MELPVVMLPTNLPRGGAPAAPVDGPPDVPAVPPAPPRPPRPAALEPPVVDLPPSPIPPVPPNEPPLPPCAEPPVAAPATLGAPATIGPAPATVGAPLECMPPPSTFVEAPCSPSSAAAQPMTQRLAISASSSNFALRTGSRAG